MNMQAQPAKDGVTLAPDPDWWRGAAIYQIYPRSYQDSNGDGIGDLAGIIQRLDYIADLGADAIWISPFFRSPMLDYGYDVSEYCDVDPMFGTLADFDALIAKAHRLGLKVMIDLVLSHTSDQHHWFVESRADRDNAKSDWFVWADPKPDGTPPNNWLSIFGGSAWEWDGTRMQYYLHNFLVQQPDLNFHNTEVQDALLDVARFWLDRGVDGFRLDTVNFYFHDNELRDNPSLSANQRNSNIAPAVNPYNFQEHLYSKNRPENLGFLKRLRDLMEEYPAVTSVGEVGDSLRGMEIQNEYTSGGDKLHMCYDFELLSGDSAPDGLRIRDVMSRAAEIVVDGWACWAHSNHDVARHASRWHLNEDARRLYAALLMSLRGSVCLYQGEELGLTEAEVGFDDLQDPYGKRFWPKFKGRDGCRTPIPWTDQAPYGGFSDSKPWLPMAPEHLERAVSLQSDDAESTHAFYKAFLAFRRHHDVLRKGSLQLTGDRADMVAFVREYEGERMTCAFNLSDREITVALPPGEWKAAPSAPFKTQCTGSGVTLPAYQAYFGIQSA